MNAAIFGAALLAAPLSGCDRISRAVDGGLSGTCGKPQSMVMKPKQAEAMKEKRTARMRVEFKLLLHEGKIEIKDAKAETGR